MQPLCASPRPARIAVVDCRWVPRRCLEAAGRQLRALRIPVGGYEGVETRKAARAAARPACVMKVAVRGARAESHSQESARGLKTNGSGPRRPFISRKRR